MLSANPSRPWHRLVALINCTALTVSASISVHDNDTPELDSVHGCGSTDMDSVHSDLFKSMVIERIICMMRAGARNLTNGKSTKVSAVSDKWIKDMDKGRKIKGEIDKEMRQID
ncbi:hypothetical protein PoB_006723400 [Plakobranchus ocellatus]|uniref:Uncharacterized protein n=1 Tax=Plakobranchus ocellatus TaxID=259542 RepID=A0AAV4D971_9GAST|nr:hypothetical protein PoB_006723400 [Plakobranchus ocellatus]